MIDVGLTSVMVEADPVQPVGIVAIARPVSNLKFDRITRLVSRTLHVPVALVSFVDDVRQIFKSQVGLSEPWATTCETPLTHSFCRIVVTSAEPLVVTDARTDPRVSGNLAIRDLGVVAYLGVPLRDPSGHVLGALCAIDQKPRAWTETDVATLRDLADIVEENLGLEVAGNYWRNVLNGMPQIVWSTLSDGYHDFYNDRWYEFTGMPYGSTDGEGWNGMFHADDQDRAWELWRHALATGTPYEIEYRLRHHSGEYRWTLGRALPIRNRTGEIERWLGTCTDIHDLKESEEARDLIGRELSHRIQNIFAVVNGLVSTAARSAPEAQDYAKSLSERIHALASAHRYVGTEHTNFSVRTIGHDKTLQGLIASILAPYHRGPEDGTVQLSGDNAAIDMRAATSLALVLHELATNAVKYGALSAGKGTVAVSCRQTDSAMTIRWSEQGGPEVKEPPQRTGFGSLLLNAMLTQLSASVERAWDRDGFKAVVTVPMDKLNRDAATGVPAA